jgi:phosphopantothenate---cysteine ligase (CTP)
VNCIVTAGPTFEPLDQVRRLTNFSTGRLGLELAGRLAGAGHRVTLLLSEQATWPGPILAHQVERFSTTASLQDLLRSLAAPTVQAVFHVAAVSDFAFGRIWAEAPGENSREIQSGKISTQEGVLLAELIPTPKLIAQLRLWFPHARLMGWKYEVDGGRESVLAKARAQMAGHRTDACVANGPAYGAGFGLVRASGSHQHLADHAALYAALLQWVQEGTSAGSTAPT